MSSVISSTVNTIRVGRVTAYRRGKVWYLRYRENGRRQQVRGSTDKQAARQLAAQVNAQLETGVPAATSFEPISVESLRQRWLDFHEHVKQSSVATVARYRTATQHLVGYIESQRGRIKLASNFKPHVTEDFARWLRLIKVAPNGHKNATKRTLLDKGVTYILECCRSLFSYAIKHRHLPPYHDNPFAAIGIDSMEIENARPIVLLNVEQEQLFLNACNTREYCIFLMLMLTGMRPGELCHLLLDDIDTDAGVVQLCRQLILISSWVCFRRCEIKGQFEFSGGEVASNDARAACAALSDSK